MKKFKMLASLLFYLIAALLGAAWGGFVLTHLWAWFIVPTFGAPVLGIPAAIGLVLVVSFMTSQYQENSDGGGGVADYVIRTTVLLSMRPAVALVVGWVVSFWMKP